MRSQHLSTFVAVLALATLAACGGSGSNNTVQTPPPPPTVSVSVSPGSASLVSGGTQQFSATVSGSSNTAVTWSVAGGGSIDSNGLYTAPSLVSSQANVSVTATAQADTTKHAGAKVTLLALKSLVVTPRGPAISLTGTQQFKATGNLSDGSARDWTAKSTWSSSYTAAATIASSGLASGTGSAGVTTIKALSTDGSGVFATTALNVTTLNLSAANLKGQYAFSLTHAGIRGQGFEVGSFVADGNGKLTGWVDSNASIGGTPSTGLAVTGTYNAYPDGRGTMTLTTVQGSNTFNFVLSNDGPPSTRGKLTLSDNTGVDAGTLELVTSFPAGLNGPYALLLGGVDGTLLSGSQTYQNPEALAGQFNASAGVISTGFMDVNDNGSINAGAGATSALSFTASYTTPDSNGRGTMKVTPPLSISGTAWNFAYYVVSANKVLLIQTDQQAAPPTIPALAGTAELQSSSTFDNTAVSGNSYVFLAERSASMGLFGVAGQLAFGASNALAGEIDVNKLGVTVNAGLGSSTYGNVLSNGRGIITVSSPSTSFNSAVFYVISPNRMYVLETDTKANAGVAEGQTNTTTPLSGILSFELAQLATAGFDSSFSGQYVTTQPAGIADSNIGVNYVESAASSSMSTPGAAGAIDGSGRGEADIPLGQFGPLSAGVNAGFYLVSPTKMVVFGLQSTLSSYQAPDGVVEKQ